MFMINPTLENKIIDTYLDYTNGILHYDEGTNEYKVEFEYKVELPCDEDIVFNSRIDMINNFIFNICEWIDNI